jgi:hypothetical protein
MQHWSGIGLFFYQLVCPYFSSIIETKKNQRQKLILPGFSLLEEVFFLFSFFFVSGNFLITSD